MGALFALEPGPSDTTRAGRPTPGRDFLSSDEPSGGGYGSVVETDIPARLDALPWSRFHTRVVVALGITWILDGLEVTLTGALSGALKQPL
jgi:hypothetical protein